MAKPLLLRVAQGPKSGFCLECIPSRVSTIGRSRGNTLQIKDSGISQRHLCFRWTDPEWTVTDEGSANGTIVNDVEIEANKELIVKTGDVIKIGEDTTISVETASVPDQPRAATKAKAASKIKDVVLTKIIPPQAENQQEVVISTRTCLEGGDLDLDRMTVGQWFEHLMEQTPTYLYQVSESLTQKMKLESKQFDEYLYSLKSSGKADNPVECTDV